MAYGLGRGGNLKEYYYGFILDYVQSLTCQQSPYGEVWIMILTNGEAFSSQYLDKCFEEAIDSVRGHP